MPPADADRAALLWLRTHLHTPRRDRAVASFSRLGEHGAGWVSLGLVRAPLEREPGRRSDWLRGARTVALSYAVNQAIKLLVRRRRPELPGLPPLSATVSQLSFPSAHATTSFAAASAYGELGARAPLWAGAVSIALSRLYLGVHYPSDVLAGAALGVAIAQARK